MELTDLDLTMIIAAILTLGDLHPQYMRGDVKDLVKKLKEELYRRSVIKPASEGSQAGPNLQSMTTNITEGITHVTDEGGNLLLTVGLQQNQLFVWGADGTTLQRSYRDILKTIVQQQAEASEGE